jgi:hypothetical protein
MTSPVMAIIVQVAKAMCYDGSDLSRFLSHHNSNARPNGGPRINSDRSVTMETTCSMSHLSKVN